MVVSKPSRPSYARDEPGTPPRRHERVLQRPKCQTCTPHAYVHVDMNIRHFGLYLYLLYLALFLVKKHIAARKHLCEACGVLENIEAQITAKPKGKVLLLEWKKEEQAFKTKVVDPQSRKDLPNPYDLEKPSGSYLSCQFLKLPRPLSQAMFRRHCGWTTSRRSRRQRK